MDAKRIDHRALASFAAAVYARAGVPEDDANLIADSLVQADLWGHQSHGVMRLDWYLARIVAGKMDPVTRPTIAVDCGALAVLDGHDGVGQVLAHRAMKDAIRRA